MSTWALAPHLSRGADRPIRVALAEDDDDLRFVLADALVSEGMEVSFLPDGVALMDHLAHAQACDREPDLLVLDHHMPGMEGLEVLRRLREAGSPLPVIVVTGFGSEVRPRARALGARAVFDKPLDLELLLLAIKQCTGRALHCEPRAERTSADCADPSCAACASTEYVRLDDVRAGVCFCIDCWRQSAPPGPYEDVGGSG